MSKLKTKSGAKKRFRMTGAGRLLRGQACKRHLLRHRSRDMKRAAKGSAFVSDADHKTVKRHFLPYGL